MNCWCGHPKERHNWRGGNIDSATQCSHCACMEYAERPETEESEKSHFDDENASHRACECQCKKCVSCLSKPQDEPKECQECPVPEECDTPCTCPCHQESETEFRAINLLKIILPMAKAHAAAHPVGSNKEFVERTDEFLKSLEK